jgi:uncharacterized protein
MYLWREFNNLTNEENMMNNPGWSYTESPFHEGELAIQAKLGVQEQIDRQGRRIIRDYLSEQHQQFFAQLPYVIVGTVDKAGNPWASILVGQPGFIKSSTPQSLQIMAKPLTNEPLANTLTEGIEIGLLGIELHTRRRNRLNGIVTAINHHGFEVQVKQSFGNCPQYIQARKFEFQEKTLNSQPVRQIELLGESEKALIASADTFFIATAYQAKSTGKAKGVDVSHRGGKPGFVRIDNERALTIPDFSGNNHFNTLGNLLLNPHAGILFIDFSLGNLLYLTGKAEIIWDKDQIKAYQGAERLLHFYLEQGYFIEGILPWRWSTPELSPFLKNTGSR